MLMSHHIYDIFRDGKKEPQLGMVNLLVGGTHTPIIGFGSSLITISTWSSMFSTGCGCGCGCSFGFTTIQTIGEVAWFHCSHSWTLRPSSDGSRYLQKKPRLLPMTFISTADIAEGNATIGEVKCDVAKTTPREEFCMPTCNRWSNNKNKFITKSSNFTHRWGITSIDMARLCGSLNPPKAAERYLKDAQC